MSELFEQALQDMKERFKRIREEFPEVTDNEDLVMLLSVTSQHAENLRETNLVDLIARRGTEVC